MPQQQLTKAMDEAAVRRSMAAYKIRRYRQRHNLTATALAEQLGVSDVAVLYWESGHRRANLKLQGLLHAEGICSANDWHAPAPEDDAGPSGLADTGAQ